MTLHADVVVPTTGRSSLAALLHGIAGQEGPRPGRVVVVDDRPGDPARGLGGAVPAALLRRTLVVRSRGRGPAAARNAGWRATTAEWVAFLDDDVLVPADWTRRLAADLDGLAADVAGSQGRVRVPRPVERRPTDWERNVIGLEEATWATADIAYRRSALEAAGGFDERFPRAYREDADLGLRITGRGLRIVRGGRAVVHPAAPAGPWVSLAKQAGNRDDPLMRRLHGRHWRERAGAPRGRIGRHAAVAAAGVLATSAAAARRPRLGAAAAGAWLAGTAELAVARIAGGPRNWRELATMVATSVAMPFVATIERARGELAAPLRARRPGPGSAASAPSPPAAVLLDRDGTLVVDVPYNGDPDRVVAMRGAREALDRLRAARIPLAVASNQSGIARGLLTARQVAAVNRRIDELLGPFGPWAVCPHGPEDGCACRKPAPGLVHRAAAELLVTPGRCVLIGDIGADLEAARAAGARGILVPTPATRAEEVAAALELAPDLGAAVDLLLGAGPAARGTSRHVAQAVAA